MSKFLSLAAWEAQGSSKGEVRTRNTPAQCSKATDGNVTEEGGLRRDEVTLAGSVSLRHYCLCSHRGDGVQLNAPLLQEDLDQAEPTGLCGN